MSAAFSYVRRVCAAVLCMAVLAWSTAPSTAHAPSVFETIQDHLEIVAAHGHSHGFEEDLYWAMHGHSHDTADHDHSQAFFSVSGETSHLISFQDIWRLSPLLGEGHHKIKIERPPRA